MPDVLSKIDVTYELLRRLLGVRAQASNREGSKTSTRVSPLKVDELLMINVGSQSLGGKVILVGRESVHIELTKPVCANIGDKIAMSRRIENNFRLIGWGEIRRTFNDNQ